MRPANNPYSCRGTKRQARDDSTDDEAPWEWPDDAFKSPWRSPTRLSEADEETTAAPASNNNKTDGGAASMPTSPTGGTPLAKSAAASPTAAPPPSDADSEDDDDQPPSVAAPQLHHAVRPRRLIRKPLRFRDYVSKTARKLRKREAQERNIKRLIRRAIAKLDK